MNGWMGKILHIDLSNAKITWISTQPYAEKYLGGRGIASRLYWEMVTPETKAFDPENRLIFMTGPLVGVGAPAANRMAVASKSPMAYPEGYCYGNMGGFFGAELKKAGFDGLVIEGCAPTPVYLWINDNTVELRDALSLWGQGVYRVAEMVRQAHGDKARFITTGVAGERKVRSAVICGSHDSTCMAGFGAVMGSKNLKAVVVKGTGKPSVAEPERFKELRSYTLQICKRVRLAIPPYVVQTGRTDLLEVTGKGNCYQCPMECIKGQYRYDRKLEGYRRCQAMEYYLPWKYKKEDEPVDTWFDSTVLANDYSIDTFELENMVEWLYACYQSGSLDEQETGLPLSRIGSREFLEKLLHSIAYREGFGDILAEGIMRAVEKVSEQAHGQLKHDTIAIGKQDIVPARAYLAHAIIYPMEPRMHQPILHELSFVKAAWVFNQFEPETSPVTTKVLLNIAKAFWGSEEAGYMESYKGAAMAAKLVQNRTYIKDSLGLCDFAWPITYSFNTPDHVGDPDLEAKLFTAVTGIAGEEFKGYAERIFNMQRAILLREGRRVPEEDYPAEYNFSAPLESHVPHILTPGPDGKAVELTGNILDRNKFTIMLKEYYRLRGWDEETGLLYTGP